MGVIFIKDGDIVESEFTEVSGQKAFYRLVIQEFNPTANLKYIVEPELVNKIRKIHYPYSVLKRKSSEVVTEYKKSIKLKPPGNLKVLIDESIVTNGTNVSETEFRLLNTISDYSKVSDIYKNSELLDFEITNSLVSLRKKRALKVIGKKV